MNFDNSVKNNEFFSLNQCEVTVEIHIKLRNDLSNIESENAIIDNLSIHTTLIISVMNVMVRNQIRASDVDWRITSFKFFRNETLWIRKLTWTLRCLKLVHTYEQKYIRRQKTVQMKASRRIYTHLWHVCPPMQKALEDLLETDHN